jgi:hypothetical protein
MIFRYGNCCDVEAINLERKEMKRKEGQIEEMLPERLETPPGIKARVVELVENEGGGESDASGGSGRAGGPEGDAGMGRIVWRKKRRSKRNVAGRYAIKKPALAQ